MTEDNAILNFKVELNKLDRSNFIDVRREKLVHYLNKAALFLVKKKYKGDDPGPGRLETMHPVLDDLKVLIKEAAFTEAELLALIPDQAGFDSIEELIIPFQTDHLYYISSRLNTKGKGCTTTGWIEGRYVKPERVYKELDSPFNGTRFDDTVITVSDNNLVIYKGDFSLTGLKVKYLKEPRIITGGSDGQGTTLEMELPFVDEIIDIGVSMALENFESERIKTQPSINVASVSE